MTRLEQAQANLLAAQERELASLATYAAELEALYRQAVQRFEQHTAALRAAHDASLRYLLVLLLIALAGRN